VLVACGCGLHRLLLIGMGIGHAELQRMLATQIRRDLGEGGEEPRAVLGLAQVERVLLRVADGGAEDLLVALQGLAADEGVEGQLRQPGQLQAGVLQPVEAEQVQVGQVLVDEVPLVRVLRLM
jgi:hypothetical protein